MPAASAKASRIWDLGLVVLAVLLIIFSCLDTRFWLLDTRYFMMHGPGHQPPSSQGHDYGPAGKAKLLNKQFFLIKIRIHKSQIAFLPAAAKPPGEDGLSVFCPLLSVIRSTEHLPIGKRQNATLNRYREHNADAAGNGTDAADDSGDSG